jgi:hypothetical protein
MKSKKLLKHRVKKINKRKTIKGGGMWNSFTGLFSSKKKEPQNVQNDGDIETPEFGTQINNLQKQDFVNVNENRGYYPVDEEDSGDSEYSEILNQQKEIITKIYKKLLKIKINSWSNTFYYKSVKKCKPDYQKLLVFINFFMSNNFNITDANKVLDIINVFSLNNCYKLNRKLPSLMNSLKQAIETYIEHSDLPGIADDDDEYKHHPNTKKYINTVQDVYGELEQEVVEDEKQKMRDNQNIEKQKKDFLSPQPSVYVEKMLYNRGQQQFPSYISTPTTPLEQVKNSTQATPIDPSKPSQPLSEGGKTRKHSKKNRNKKTKKH